MGGTFDTMNEILDKEKEEEEEMREEKPSTSLFIFDMTVYVFLCSVFKEREHDTQIV